MERRTVSIVAGLLLYCTLALGISTVLSVLYSDSFNSFDAGLFHSMAEVIRNGLLPYVDFADCKPPLLFFTLALFDSLAPPFSYDLLLMAALNIVSAALIWQIGREEYGNAAGFAAGLLFLVAAVAVQGYFLFSEQFVVVLVLAAYLLSRRHRWAQAGLLLGAAIGFKQYAIFGIIPFLYQMRATADPRYFRFLIPLAAVIAGMFGALYIWYGPEVFVNSVYYTFGIGPDYLAYNFSGAATNMKPTPLMLVAVVMVSVAMVLPTLVFSAASVAVHGVRTVADRTLLLFVVSFGLSLLFRQFLHYWILMLPFMALLACREFGTRKGDGAQGINTGG
jgi:hypothetical protein